MDLPSRTATLEGGLTHDNHGALNLQVKSTLSILLASVVLGLPVIIAQAMVASEDPSPLSTPVERQLTGGSSHVYRLHSTAEQFLHVRAEQKGIDVVLFLRRLSNGQEVARTDSLNGSQGEENLLALIETSGEFELVVASEYPEDAAGSYRLELIEHRPERTDDRSRVDAERLTFEAGSLWAAGSRESRRQAIERFGETLLLWRKLADTRREAEAQTNIGYLHRSLGETRAELDPYRKALLLWRRVGDREREAAVLNSLATAANKAGEGDEALDHGHRAAELFRELGDARGEGTALNTLGSVRLSQGDLAVARRLFERSLALRRQTGDRRGEGRTLNNLARVLRQQGESRQAIRLLEEALELARANGDRLGETGALNNLVTLHSLLGEMRRSLDFSHQVLAQARSMGNRRVEAFALNNMATLHHRLGEPQEAVDLYRQAAELAHQFGDRAFEAKALDNVGWAYLALDDAESARRHMEQSLELLAQIDAPRKRIITEVNLSHAHSALGDTEAALALARKAQQAARQLGDTYVQAVADLRLGEVLHDAGQAEAALEVLETVRSTVQTREFRRIESAVLFQLARTERSLGRLEVARRHMAESLDLIDSLRATVAVHDLRASFLASKTKFYQAYIDLLMEMHLREPTAGHHLAALEANERARARTLLDALEEIRGEIRQGLDPALLEQEKALRIRLNEAERQRIEALAGGATEAEIQGISGRVRDLRLENRALEERIRSGNPHYASLTQPTPLAVPDLQRLLDEKTVLLQYGLGEERSFLWTVTQDQVVAHPLPRAAILEAEARRFYELLTEPNRPVADESAAERAARLARAEEDLRAVSVRLSAALLAPAGPLLERRRVVVVAEGALLFIPFAALPLPVTAPAANTPDATAPDTTTQEPMVARHVTIHLPSASVLAGLRRDVADRPTATGELAVIADPVFRGDDRRVRQAQRAAEQATLRSGVGELEFRRLYFSRQEAEKIASLVPQDGLLKALDFSARRELATQGGLADYRRIHLATHGVLNTEVPALSGLVMSLVDENGESQEGFLRLHDIYNLDLSADLVTLSACETALGKHLRGEGMIGLTRGFMYAGAPRVVASLWQVQDRATATLMENFYRAMLQDGQSPAEALRWAQAVLWRSERWSSPYYWAPFVFHGEWR
ncbi:MAG: tetratricopeptide repeat protein [Acidobacteriota bacterium]